MPGGSVINQRRHVGLQHLAALAEISRSSLGPHKTLKFIRDDSSGESALVTSCVRILDNLDLTCAAGQLLHETVRAHHEVYGTGSGSLVFLAGAWSRAALESLQRGVLVPQVVSGMSEVLEVCLDVCRRNSLSLASLNQTNSARGLDPKFGKKVASAGPRSLRLSRHFCGPKPEDVPQEPPDVAQVAEGLSHGSQEAMKLVMEASRAQAGEGFDVTKVLTCVLPGSPEEHSRIAPGFVVLLHPDQIPLAHRLRERRLKVALIDGDLSQNYRHLGFKRLKGVERVRDRMSGEDDEWMEMVLKVLLKLEVGLVLVGGLVGDAAIRDLGGRHILVVGKVRNVREFSGATGAVAVSYIGQLTQECVGDGVHLDVRSDRKTLVNIHMEKETAVVTAIITSFFPGKLQSLEDRFWGCAHRLRHALTDAAVLPGAGVTEMLCVRELRRRADEHDRANRPHRGVVFRVMGDALVDFSAALMLNAGGRGEVQVRTEINRKLRDYRDLSQISVDLDDEKVPQKVYDNLKVKQEVWRRAVDLVLLVLQTDAEIITGVEQSDAKDLFFL